MTRAGVDQPDRLMTRRRIDGGRHGALARSVYRLFGTSRLETVPWLREEGALRWGMRG